jgi:electron transfer flavoprotein alpha subunit
VVVAFLEDPSDELSLQALTFARGIGSELRALSAGAVYAPGAWAQALGEVIAQLSPEAVVAPGSDRANEVMAHLAAHLEQPLAANCVSLTPGTPATVTRVRWGGSLLEEARVHGAPLLLTVAPHAVAAESADIELARLDPVTDSSVKVSERISAETSGVSLVDAGVVVSGGRGVGSAEGFAVIEELAELLGGHGGLASS